MHTKDNIIEFKKNNGSTVDIMLKAIEAKDYWKAQRLLNSLMSNENNAFFNKVAVDLHSKMPAYQNIEEDFLPLLFSHEFDSILLGAKGLIHYFLPINPEKSEFYFNFVKDRLTSGNVQFDLPTLEAALEYSSKNGKFAFVEKEDTNENLVIQADQALGEGNLGLALTLADKVTSFSEHSPLAHKIACEVHLKDKNYRLAEKELEKIEENEKDCYFYSLLVQLESAKHGKNINEAVEKLLSFSIENQTQLMIILETLLSLEKYKEAKNLIEKYQSMYEYFCPLYLAKWLVAYSEGDLEETKNSLRKCTILDPRRVVEKEALMCIEEGIKLPKQISLQQAYPAVVVSRAQTRIKEILEATPIDLDKYSKAQLENAFYWVELLGSEQLANSFIRQLLICKKGVDIVKNALLSFITPDWIKRLCICSLVEVGASDIPVWYIADDVPKCCKILLPEIFLQEAYSASESLEFFSFFVHQYGMALAELAFSASGFERRLQEVGEELYRAMVNISSKKKKDEKLVLAALLYCTCSDDLPLVLSTKKVACSRFSTLANASGELDITEQQLTEFIKGVL